MSLSLSALQTSERLEINISTLRSYSIFLEGKGYRFTRDTNNRRIYHENDLEVIESFTRYIREEKITKEQAAEKVLGYVDEPQALQIHNTSVTTLNASVEDMQKGIEMLSAHIFDLTSELKYMKENQQALNAQRQKENEQHNAHVMELTQQQTDDRAAIQQLVTEVHALNQKLEAAQANEAPSKRENWWTRLLSK